MNDFIACAFVTFLMLHSGRFEDAVTEGTELLMAFLVHRHGDRTPILSSMTLSEDRETLEQLVEPYGYGQLTDVGKRRSHELGKFIRNRYDGLLSLQYNTAELYLRSTDSTRAKMTALTAMTAVYPADEGRWMDDINWVPVPYTTLPVKYDYNLAIINCPVINEAYKSKMSSNSSRMEQYYDLFEMLGRHEMLLKETPTLIYTLYDLYCSKISLGIPLKPEVQELYPEIKAAAGEAIDELFGDDAHVALLAGPFLEEFFEKTSISMAGNATQKLRIYSAHDVTVYSWMAVSRVRPKQGVPEYAAAFALELRRVLQTGQFVVLPVYVSSPGEELQYLEVDGCGDKLCDIDTFRELTAAYKLNLKEWRTRCEFDDDLEIDESLI